jgi:hypothetical protein
MIALCIIRGWQRKRYAQMAPRIQEEVSNLACGMPGDKEFLFSLKGFRRRKTRGYILSAMGGIQGEARANLASLYHEMGLSREDYKLLYHKDFSVRLAAIARLEIVMDREALVLVKPLLRDSSPYVHFAALRFMLKQSKTHQPKIEAEMELAAIVNRYDIAREILDCHVKNFPQDFTHLLRTTRNPKIRDVCIDIIVKNKLVEVLPIVQDHLLEALRSEGHDDYADFDFKKYIQCLTLSPLPDTEELLIRMTEVDDALVRYNAYRSFFKIRPDLKFEYIDKLIQDSSPYIVRLGVLIREEMQKSEAAA